MNKLSPRTVSFTLFTILVLIQFIPNITANEQPPNVILIYTDDQGTVDLNCYGAKDLITPELDKLATQGVRFSQFYAAAPVCSPSRAAVLTGRFPQRAGVPGNVSSQPGALACQVHKSRWLRCSTPLAIAQHTSESGI